MGKLVVTIDWPYSNIPWISMSSLWASDVRTEPNVEIIRAVSTEVTCSSNMLIRAAIERGATEILTLSADQSCPPDVLSRLRAHDKDIVGCLIATRQPGHHWLVFDLDANGIGHKKEPKFPLTKADVIGPGCMLIKTHIFNRIPPPWFKSTLTKDGCGIIQTSDFYFFKKMKEHGVQVYVDSTLESFHQTEITLNANTLGKKLPYLDIYKAANEFIPAKASDQDALDDREGHIDHNAEIEVWSPDGKITRIGGVQ